MVRDFKNSDEGKNVMTADGEMVGTVDRISGDSAHVKPSSGLSQSTRDRLGWTGSKDTYRLRHSAVEKIADDEIHLSENP